MPFLENDFNSIPSLDPGQSIWVQTICKDNTRLAGKELIQKGKDVITILLKGFSFSRYSVHGPNI